MEAIKIGESVELRCADGVTRTLRVTEILDAGEPGVWYVRGFGDDGVTYGAYVDESGKWAGKSAS